MHILHVNSSIDLNIGTGSGERTFQISRSLSRRGYTCTILTLNLGSLEDRIEALKPAQVITVECLWQRFFIPAFSLKKINGLVAEADVVHLMSHWSILNILVYLATRRLNKPYVVCPAGALPVFGRSRFLKGLYNLAVGNAIIRNASAWVAITEGEYPDFETYGIARENVTVIPNGVNEADFPEIRESSLLQRIGLTDRPFLLFVGRLSPIKGPDLLLKAFASIAKQLPDYHLVYAGPDGGMLDMLRDMANEENLTDRVHFPGYVGGDDKIALYRAARLLVVSSRQEAMSIVALEAGICGTPALLTDQCGFSDVLNVDTRLEVGADAKSIADGLLDLLADNRVIDEISPSWRQYVMQHYTWDSMIDKYADLYGQILAR